MISSRQCLFSEKLTSIQFCAFKHFVSTKPFGPNKKKSQCKYGRSKFDTQRNKSHYKLTRDKKPNHILNCQSIANFTVSSFIHVNLYDNKFRLRVYMQFWLYFPSAIPESVNLNNIIFVMGFFHWYPVPNCRLQPK